MVFESKKKKMKRKNIISKKKNRGKLRVGTKRRSLKKSNKLVTGGASFSQASSTPVRSPDPIINVESTEKLRIGYSNDGNLKRFMELFDGPRSFYITRHFNSCNNVDKGCLKYFDPKKRKIVGKDREPMCPMKAIIETYNFALRANKENSTRFESNEVYVSCLIRTWCTAVILFCTKSTITSDSRPLNLRIFPHLKEEVTREMGLEVSKNGNYPELLSKSIKRFIRFLNIMCYLKKLDSLHGVPDSQKLNLGDLAELIDSQQKSLTHWNPPSQIILSVYDLEGNIVKNIGESIGDNEAEYHIDLCKTGTFDYDSKKRETSTYFNDRYIFYAGGSYEIPTIDFYYLPKNTRLLLQKGRFTFRSSENTNRSEYTNEIKGVYESSLAEIIKRQKFRVVRKYHVVCHSNVMSHLMRTYCQPGFINETEKLVAKEGDNKYREAVKSKLNITSQNCGTIVVYKPNEISHFQYLPGYANKKYFKVDKDTSDPDFKQILLSQKPEEYLCADACNY